MWQLLCQIVPVSGNGQRGNVSGRNFSGTDWQSTRGTSLTPRTIFGLKAAVAGRRIKDLKYYKRAPGVGKGRRWGLNPVGVQQDADQLQGRPQEVGRDHWTKVLGGDRGKRSLGHLSQKFAIGEADWGVPAH